MFKVRAMQSKYAFIVDQTHTVKAVSLLQRLTRASNPYLNHLYQLLLFQEIRDLIETQCSINWTYTETPSWTDEGSHTQSVAAFYLSIHQCLHFLLTPLLLSVAFYCFTFSLLAIIICLAIIKRIAKWLLSSFFQIKFMEERSVCYVFDVFTLYPLHCGYLPQFFASF